MAAHLSCADLLGRHQQMERATAQPPPRLQRAVAAAAAAAAAGALGTAGAARRGSRRSWLARQLLRCSELGVVAAASWGARETTPLATPLPRRDRGVPRRSCAVKRRKAAAKACPRRTLGFRIGSSRVAACRWLREASLEGVAAARALQVSAASHACPGRVREGADLRGPTHCHAGPYIRACVNTSERRGGCATRRVARQPRRQRRRWWILNASFSGQSFRGIGGCRCGGHRAFTLACKLDMGITLQCVHDGSAVRCSCVVYRNRARVSTCPFNSQMSNLKGNIMMRNFKMMLGFQRRGGGAM
eukprot:365359-Chlamydomonas_euryale.AAC.8